MSSILERHANLARDPDLCFCSATCRAGRQHLTVALAQELQKTNDVLLHVTGNEMHEADILNVLKQAKAAGVQNVLALRGDGDARGRFSSSVELVRFIGDFF